MEKRAVVDEEITPPEDKSFDKKAKMWPKEVRIDELDKDYPVRRLTEGAEKAISNDAS